MNIRRLLLVFCGFSLCLQVSLAAFEIKHGPGRFAQLVYPAADHFPLEAGSFELRFRPGFDPDLQAEVPFYMPMVYLTVMQGKTTLFSILSRYTWNASTRRRSSSLMLTGQMIPDGKLRMNHSDIGLRRGAWHDLIICWEPQHGQVLWQIWFDGKLVLDAREPAGSPFLLDEESRLYVGARYFNCCYAAIDWMRLSWGRRTPETFAPVADRQTMLLERYQPGQFSGQLNGSHRFVDTPDGRQALELFTQAEEE